ncbi:phosphotransferase enzyme family protein [Microlunatus endophyticus]|nr:phosphotransferase [Microlunatus endophyticus]
MIMEATQGALRHWNLEPVTGVERATSGVMNQTYLVSTAQRRLVLRRHRRSVRDEVEFEHAVIAHARARGIPAPAAISTPDGEAIVDHDGAFHSLFAFARGQQVSRGELTAPHARSMGEMLARLDLALADFPVPPRAAREHPADLAPVAVAVDHLLQRIGRRSEQSERDRWAADLLRTKAAWLQAATPPIWRDPPGDELQLVHGDYQESNLFFDPYRTVVDVIDWDKADVGWPPAEIVRTLDLALRLDPELCAPFIDGYRTVRPVSIADLDQAAGNWNYNRIHDHWVLEGIYLRDDDRLRIFLEPGPFVPFADKWARLRPLLD